MNNVIVFRTKQQLSEDDERRIKLQTAIMELDTHIIYLEGLATNSPISELGVDKRFNDTMIKKGVHRINTKLRKEISGLKGRRTKLQEKMNKL